LLSLEEAKEVFLQHTTLDEGLDVQGFKHVVTYLLAKNDLLESQSTEALSDGIHTDILV
jgi:hypothetical protein